MKRIVISAVNLRKGGTLTILRQCLSYLSSVAEQKEWKIIALVHRKELADYPNIEYIELPWSIESWGKRLWCEYVTMNKISKEITKNKGEIDLWFSLHDTTPIVQAKKQASYWHAPFPFFEWKFRDFSFDKKIPIFALFIHYAYLFNVKKNSAIIVQQEWLREGFSKKFKIPEKLFTVAPPRQTIEVPKYEKLSAGDIYTFFFASTPDGHKNFETLCEASKLLEDRLGKDKFQTIITVAKSEKNYAAPYTKFLQKNWGKVASIKFAGVMDKPTLYAHYDLADCFVFPSRIETWGLPISEFMLYKKPMILSDLPYAHETSQGSSQTAFFPPCDAKALAELMYQAYNKDYRAFKSVELKAVDSPFANNWEELFSLLLN